MNRKDLPEANATCETCGHRYRVCKTCAKMRSRGIDAWRTHCDCAECYQIYILTNMDYKDITREAYDRAMQLELPEDREPTREVQKKLDGIENYLSEKEKEQAEANKAAQANSKDRVQDNMQDKAQPKQEVKFYRNK